MSEATGRSQTPDHQHDWVEGDDLHSVCRVCGKPHPGRSWTRCPSVYPPSATGPYSDERGWSGPLRCVMTAGHGNHDAPARHWNTGINWTDVHKPFSDDGVTYCGWDGHMGCGEVWPCSTVRASDDASEPPHPRVCPNGLDCPCYDKPWTADDASSSPPAESGNPDGTETHHRRSEP